MLREIAMMMVLVGCGTDDGVADTTAAATSNTPAASIGYSYSKVAAPTGGLTATNVQDGINQCAAVGYYALATSESYTDGKIGTEAAARAAGDSAALASAEAYADQHAAGALAAAESYTDQQVAGEATARTNAVSAEAAARQAADGAESGARQAADSAEAAARQAADSAETAARQAADSAESAARQGADGLEASARQAADQVEAGARLAADNAEAGARQQGDQDTLAAAKAYTDQSTASTGAAPVDQAPFGSGRTKLGCSCTNGVCSGFCGNNNNSGTLTLAQPFAITSLSFVGPYAFIVQFCNSHTSACIWRYIPANTPVSEELRHPVAMDSMTLLCVSPGPCDQEMTYNVLGFFGSGGQIADQTPFDTGSTSTACSCTHGVCTGFCSDDGSGNVVKTAPQLLNLTSFSVYDADGMEVDFCNSKTNACFVAQIQPGVLYTHEFEHPFKVDTMTVLSTVTTTFTYHAVGYY
jgi:hypothetical protein